MIKTNTRLENALPPDSTRASTAAASSPSRETMSPRYGKRSSMKPLFGSMNHDRGKVGAVERGRI